MPADREQTCAVAGQHTNVNIASPLLPPLQVSAAPLHQPAPAPEQAECRALARQLHIALVAGGEAAPA